MQAQGHDSAIGVAVRVWAAGTTNTNMESHYLSVSGHPLPLTPDGTDGVDLTSYDDSAGSVTAFLCYDSSKRFVRVEPDKSYTFGLSSDNFNGGTFNVIAPPGYRVIIDGLYRNSRPIDGTESVTFTVLPATSRHPGLAGMASSVAGTEVAWTL